MKNIATKSIVYLTEKSEFPGKEELNDRRDYFRHYVRTLDVLLPVLWQVTKGAIPVRVVSAKEINIAGESALTEGDALIISDNPALLRFQPGPTQRVLHLPRPRVAFGDLLLTANLTDSTIDLVCLTDDKNDQQWKFLAVLIENSHFLSPNLDVRIYSTDIKSPIRHPALGNYIYPYHLETCVRAIQRSIIFLDLCSSSADQAERSFYHSLAICNGSAVIRVDTADKSSETFWSGSSHAEQQLALLAYKWQRSLKRRINLISPDYGCLARCEVHAEFFSVVEVLSSSLAAGHRTQVVEKSRTQFDVVCSVAADISTEQVACLMEGFARLYGKHRITMIIVAPVISLPLQQVADDLRQAEFSDITVVTVASFRQEVAGLAASLAVRFGLAAPVVAPAVWPEVLVDLTRDFDLATFTAAVELKLDKTGGRKD